MKAVKVTEICTKLFCWTERFIVGIENNDHFQSDVHTGYLPRRRPIYLTTPCHFLIYQPGNPPTRSDKMPKARKLLCPGTSNRPLRNAWIMNPGKQATCRRGSIHSWRGLNFTAGLVCPAIDRTIPIVSGLVIDRNANLIPLRELNDFDSSASSRHDIFFLHRTPRQFP